MLFTICVGLTLAVTIKEIVKDPKNNLLWLSALLLSVTLIGRCSPQPVEDSQPTQYQPSQPAQTLQHHYHVEI